MFFFFFDCLSHFTFNNNNIGNFAIIDYVKKKMLWLVASTDALIIAL